MVKARQLCLVSLCSAACAGRQKAADDIIPVAKSIAVYSAGGSVVSGVIDSAALGARRLRLPSTVAAINLSQGDQSLPPGQKPRRERLGGLGDGIGPDVGQVIGDADRELKEQHPQPKATGDGGR